MDRHPGAYPQDPSGFLKFEHFAKISLVGEKLPSAFDFATIFDLNFVHFLFIDVFVAHGQVGLTEKGLWADALSGEI